MLITNLYNHTLPLIRYELTDEVTSLGGQCPCGSVFTSIADVQGRLDDTFVYSGPVTVHPHVFRSVLAQHKQIVEYQVRQSARGVDVYVLAESEIDTLLLARRIEEAIAALGLRHPVATVTPVVALDRQATGKFKRFVPLLG